MEGINNRIDRQFGFEQHFIRRIAKMTTRVGLTIAVMMAMALSHVQQGRPEQMRSPMQPIPATGQLRTGFDKPQCNGTKLPSSALVCRSLVIRMALSGGAAADLQSAPPASWRRSAGPIARRQQAPRAAENLDSANASQFTAA